MNFETRCVHTGVDKDKAFNSCTTPIYTSSTFSWDTLTTNNYYPERVEDDAGDVAP